MTTHYLLSCSISAEVRQSVQIKFDDLKLPTRVVETLVANNTVSIRPNLSNALKSELDSLRVMQRDLYDSYCIHYGDAHFVTSSYFNEANQLISQIKSIASEANEKLKDLWDSEYAKWQETAEGILRPLFTDDTEYSIAFSAYMKFFPTKEEYKTPIRVSVLGPLPVSLQKVTAPIEGDIDSLIAYENQINTTQVLQAAQNSAADRALIMGAELIDDLDTRHITKIGRQQTGSEKKRGSWQITAEKLRLISDSVPGFSHLTTLAEDLLAAGNDLQSPNKDLRTKATENFYNIQEQIRSELEGICNQRDQSKGLEKLKQSIALSNQYKTLCERIKNAENANALNLLTKDAAVEIDVYEQRSKMLKKLIAQRKELIGSANEKLDTLIDEVKSTDSEEVDF